MPKLPNSERAVVEIGKLRDYSLNQEHEVGKHKARVFKAALGITIDEHNGCARRYYGRCWRKRPLMGRHRYSVRNTSLI